MEVNEKLLEEKRELVQKIIEAEEMGSKATKTASTVQYRYPQSLFTHVHDAEQYEYYSFLIISTRSIKYYLLTSLVA